MRSPSSSKEVQSLTGRLAVLNQFISKATDRCQPFFQTIKGGRRFEWTEECEKAFQDLKILLEKAPLLSKPKNGETLLVYLAVFEKADAETRYSDMEKLALSLIIASRKLRPYFQSHSIEVLTNLPLRQILQKLDTSGWLMKWSIELSQFDISYKPRASIKGQALADFVAEFAHILEGSLEAHPDEIPRVENGYADALSKLESSKDSDLMKAILVEKLSRPSIDESLPTMAMTISESPRWIKEIIAYLNDQVLPSDKQEA
ncbi:Uncharacterized protein Adt_18849 [Abeliophyllum distichum]|uniref:Reverse transcriptase RNase H-like domain-containing protein n=1 Tax=Abeliophyllum distichum TaxID=126358 RepID=A0ABD1TKP7_9LAMI